MTHERPSIAAILWGIIVVAVLWASQLPSSAANAEEQEITVNVHPSEPYPDGAGVSYTNNVAVGFGLIPPSGLDLTINLTCDVGTIVRSWLVEDAGRDGGYLWHKISETKWQCTGIGSNDPFWCVIKCEMAYEGPGGGEALRWASVSDADLDADTDNNSYAQDPPDFAPHRPPSRSPQEDTTEFPCLTTPDLVGLVVALDDDNDVDWYMRDWNGSVNYDDPDVLDAVVEIHPKKAGEWNVAADAFHENLLEVYTSDDIAIHEADRNLAMNQSAPFNLRLRCPLVAATGSRSALELIFTPHEPTPGAWNICDEINYMFLGCDIDVDGDNDGSIDDVNFDGLGEDFFEAHPGDHPLYVAYPELKLGMIVGVNDVDSDGDGNPDNGWTGTDWSGPQANTMEDPFHFQFRPGVLRGLGVGSESQGLLDPLYPAVKVTKVSGGGAVRLFRADTCEPIGVFDDHESVDAIGSDSLWRLLRDQDLDFLVEGLRAGEVVLRHELYLGAHVLHSDEIRITVINVQVTNIKFNHNHASSATDAVNIRQDFTHAYDISNGEWVTNPARNFPVCYAITTSATVKARLTVEPSYVTCADIEAWAVTSDGWLNGEGSLGHVVKKKVDFVSGVSFVSGDPDPEYVTFEMTALMPNRQPSVQRTGTDFWQWKAGNVNGLENSSYDMKRSGPHTVYLILAEPVTPWNNTFGDQRNAWTVVLDHACVWANRATTNAGAVSGVTNGGYSSFGKTYDGTGTHSSGTNCNLTSMMRDTWVDCRDMSAVVQLFSNVLGVTGVQVRRVDGSPTFRYNRILPIGRSTWTSGAWSFHQFGWYGGLVYDACIELNEAAPYIPIGTGFTGDYQTDLLDPRDTWTPRTAETITTFD